MEDNRRLKKLIGTTIGILVIIVAVFFVVKLFSSPKNDIDKNDYLISGEVISIDRKNRSFVVDRGYPESEGRIVTVKTKIGTDVTVFTTYRQEEFDKLGIDVPKNKEKKIKFSDMAELMEVNVTVTKKTKETDEREFVAKKIRVIDDARNIPPDILNDLLEKMKEKEEEKLKKEKEEYEKYEKQNNN